MKILCFLNYLFGRVIYTIENIGRCCIWRHNTVLGFWCFLVAYLLHRIHRTEHYIGDGPVSWKRLIKW